MAFLGSSLCRGFLEDVAGSADAGVETWARTRVRSKLWNLRTPYSTVTAKDCCLQIKTLAGVARPLFLLRIEWSSGRLLLPASLLSSASPPTVPSKKYTLAFQGHTITSKRCLFCCFQTPPALGPGGTFGALSWHLPEHPRPPYSTRAALGSSQVSAKIFLVALFPFWERRKIQNATGTLVIQKDLLYI